VKLKKPSRAQWLLIAAVAVAVVLVLGHRRSADPAPDAGKLDDPAKRTCSDFAKNYPGAKTKPARLSLADRTLASSAHTENGTISRRVSELGRNADDGGDKWKTSADNLIDACRNAGWTAL
jgi:hypothetical protein